MGQISTPDTKIFDKKKPPEVATSGGFFMAVHAITIKNHSPVSMKPVIIRLQRHFLR